MEQKSYLDGAAVLAFYQSTGKKHLFLTGERGSGKTHLLRSITALLSHSQGSSKPFHHLISHKTQDGQVVIHSDLIAGDAPFPIGRLHPGTGQTPVTKACPTPAQAQTLLPKIDLSPPQAQLPLPGNAMEMVEDGFLRCGIPAIERYLRNQPTEYFVIDEIGYLESSCPVFQERVEELLDHSRVIAVLRKQSTEFLDRLREREDAVLLDLDDTFRSLSCILMASGMSKRFGSNKLLAPFHGISLFENAIRITRFVGFGEVLAVTRHGEIGNLSRENCLPFFLHHMPDRSDMVRLGVSRLLEGCIPAGILFLPSDQPLLSTYSMQLLCLTFLYHRDKICRLSYNAVPSSPILFPPQFFHELQSLPGKQGGGFLAKKYPEQVLLVPAREEYELYDIDTPEDLILLSQYPV